MNNQFEWFWMPSRWHSIRSWLRRYSDSKNQKSHFAGAFSAEEAQECPIFDRVKFGRANLKTTTRKKKQSTSASKAGVGYALARPSSAWLQVALSMRLKGSSSSVLQERNKLEVAATPAEVTTTTSTDNDKQRHDNEKNIGDKQNNKNINTCTTSKANKCRNKAGLIGFAKSHRHPKSMRCKLSMWWFSWYVVALQINMCFCCFVYFLV